ncbi:amino acid ABC transporter permease [Heyndrickxia sporothermodurans]|uniref:Amino acid ABC transporter permease n=1 Tax=Heyndrickxia sporothermodurans TaxID=46224 RepID=A0AB37HIP4_9BACI|nr:amino acid ABC transporter permease [Heyndrickxia sporothermodurans]MBL5767980.1 amino acid ABC transporter permease [Heyndrickxia sporothermodurans]MBL5771537.1 amino acid ABC transporter permease [Heyndrickxia sporothermodurans]MBL5775238.1 amino acid ABC transporter permease [Heyndrickxia sporothermodurans]MBL5778658.1 amino acid ABC transporter permease [Heyndrickxia sporothermodurans]MBL5782632.1 amino acid ABC transporter permease [Heyndrickxia sporothermodurans]
MDFRFDLIADYLPLFLRGTLITIEVSVLGILFGTILGLFIGLGKMMKNKYIRLPFVWYINFFRGTPLFLQILLVHFGVIPAFINDTNAFIALITALSLNSAAYIAEIFRAGIQSIDRGQMEAARSLGMNHKQAMRNVILPQAFKRMIPPLGNEFVVLIKDSSLGAIIAAPELMYWGRAMQGQYYRPWEPYLTTALIYLILTLTLSYVLEYVERKVKTE